MKINKFARLARIELSRRTENEYGRDVERIREHMRLLETTSSNSRHARPHAANGCALREDVPFESGTGAALLRLAPDRFGDYFRVPRFVSDE